MEHHRCADISLQQGVVQFASDPGALADSLFEPKFNDASSDGPAVEGSNEKRADRCCWHDKKDSALHVLHVRDGLCQLSANLLISALDQYCSLGLQRFHFVVQPKSHGPPVARSGQRGDGLELRRESDLNRFQGWQKRWIHGDFRRQVREGNSCSLSLFKESPAQ